MQREQERTESTGDKIEPKHMAVIKARLLILQLITDFFLKNNTNKKTKKKRCYNKIVNTSIALETVPKIHRKVFLFFIDSLCG